MKIKIKKATETDICGLMKLDKLLEEHPWNRRSRKNWKWKYFTQNPAGKANIYIATKETKILACFAAIPIKYLIRKKIITAYHSIAMMVHPDWQNRGLIGFVAEKLFEAIKKKKYLLFTDSQIKELINYIKINLITRIFLVKKNIL